MLTAFLSLVIIISGCKSSADSDMKSDALAGSGSFGELTFRDEFDGKEIDASKWYVRYKPEGNWPDMIWRRNYKKENAYIENGALVIRTIREGTDEKPSFSTAMISTNEYGKPILFQQAYGRFEAKVKFPKQQGHWCAFWLMTQSVGHVDNSGRDGTEIDIMEKAWTLSRIQHALHWDGYGDYHKSASQKVEFKELNDGDWHIIRLDWYPNVYVFFVDGKETWRTNAGGVCQVPNFIIFSDEIGNSGSSPEGWGGGPITEAKLPDYFIIDYVRVYAYVPEKS
jgi:beta-glucanase (GH16 family)